MAITLVVLLVAEVTMLPLAVWLAVSAKVVVTVLPAAASCSVGVKVRSCSSPVRVAGVAAARV